MTEKLRLGPLPKTETVRLTITLPAAVKADLDRYAELYGRIYGEPIDVAGARAAHAGGVHGARSAPFRRVRQDAVPRSGGRRPVGVDERCDFEDQRDGRPKSSTPK